ncbi:hypothetical protein Poli38472_007319 [Pythium oligandrum]|uniref:FYVE-type domain-containing protein n=1 Tax=Pythium oligandrum TaxID=41045 RepID=A0A8K1FFN5_PYTOL|nr:hypothetical protein Poli38472_007319 [Pythium oligandrum]|eukprot:TMW59174.1 hypothetical protein Poli38472_007319 [Pythium oligandrum]
MGVDFPVPRDVLPAITVTQDEYAARKEQMQALVQQTIDEYEFIRRAAGANADGADITRWKEVGSRDSLKVYRERRTFSKTNVNDEDGVVWLESDSGQEKIGSHCPLSSPTGLKLLLRGELHGKMENAMYAIVSRSREELALTFELVTADGLTDCELLNVMEEPTAEQPYNFLGYKWVVFKSPMGGRLVKHRDSVFLEHTGISRLSNGEQIGFHMQHHVDLPDFPEMRERKCSRFAQSLRFLYRQKAENVVEIFMLGAMNLGTNPVLRSFGTRVAMDNALRMGSIMECAEIKRLTKMLAQARLSHPKTIASRRNKATGCALCGQEKKFYIGVSLVDCTICERMICSRCRTNRRVYLSGGSTSRFHRLLCCKNCVLDANHVTPAVVQEDPLQPKQRDQVMQRISQHIMSYDLNPARVRTRSRRSNSDSSIMSVETVQIAEPVDRSDGKRSSSLPHDEIIAYSQLPAPSKNAPSDPAAMFRRMLELQQAAESTYMATQQTTLIMQEQAMSSGRGRPPLNFM